MRIPGGHRPVDEPRVAAWRAFERAWEAGGVVVARCPACDMPMWAPQGDAISWDFDGLGFSVRAGVVEGATRAEASARVKTLVGPRWRWREVPAIAVVIGLILLPAGFLVFSLSFISAFVGQIFERAR